MSYTKVNWQNSPTATTPVGATNLNHLEQGVVDAHYPPLVAALPNSPIDGQIAYLAPASFQSGSGPTATYDPPIACRYRATTSAAYHWEALSGEIERTQSPSPDTVSSLTYVSATGGTGPTGIIVPNAGEWDVEISAQLTGDTGGTANGVTMLYLSYDVGATGATDADALIVPCSRNASTIVSLGHYTRRYRRTFPTASVALTPRARTGNLVASPTWLQWRIAVYPVLIG